jgi:hypothetical protein
MNFPKRLIEYCCSGFHAAVDARETRRRATHPPPLVAVDQKVS